MDVKKLIKKMSLKEKIYQLQQLPARMFLDGGRVCITGPITELDLDKDNIFEIGSVLNSVGAERAITMQDMYLEKSKNKIPMLMMQDVIHGYRTIYPINLSLAGSFDLELAKACASMAAKESSVEGIHVTFAPMVDLVRDARWGRVMESSGEDSYLNAQMARATVEGYQGDFGKYKIAACVKHFAAYGAAESGKDYNTVDMSERTLREYYLPPYKSATDAGVAMAMTAFNVVDGIPCVANSYLVNDILRKEWGYDGVVISDYNAFVETIDHGYCENRKAAAQGAMNATCDMEMASTTYVHHLEELVSEGKISEEQIDKAVLRILELKNKLGLFENHHKDTSVEESKKFVLCDEHRALAKYAAEESAVLLKNDGILPFSKDVKTVAVIGPHADNGRIVGAWSCAFLAEDTTTVLAGVKNMLPNANVLYAKGCDIELDATDTSMIDEAVDIAKQADIVILCLGEEQEDSGESHSKMDLNLPGVQYLLLDRVLEVNKNTAVLLFNGRPMTIKRLNDTAPAILDLFFPGTEGGSAAASLLFGEKSPSGKLTMSFPYSVGQCPVYYNFYSTGRPRDLDRDNERIAYQCGYIDGPNKPLFPFGYGLSYSSFEYSDYQLSADTMKKGERITASVKVKNTGKYKAKETVQLYIRDLFGSTVRPVKELKGFEKIELMPNEEKVVSFEITEDSIAFVGRDLQRKAEAGTFHVFIGKNSDCKPFAEFEYLS